MHTIASPRWLTLEETEAHRGRRYTENDADAAQLTHRLRHRGFTDITIRRCSEPDEKYVTDEAAPARWIIVRATHRATGSLVRLNLQPAEPGPRLTRTWTVRVDSTHRLSHGSLEYDPGRDSRRLDEWAPPGKVAKSLERTVLLWSA